MTTQTRSALGPRSDSESDEGTEVGCVGLTDGGVWDAALDELQLELVEFALGR